MSNRPPKANRSQPNQSSKLQKYTFRIDKGQHEERLDIALTKLMPDFSRRKIRSVIDTGGCYINKKRARTNSRKVHLGDIIQLEFKNESIKKRPPVAGITKEDYLYEDDEIIAICKPAGVASQATRTNAKQHVLAQVKMLALGAYTPYLIHRLDQETSGVMLIAKSKEASDTWSALFKERAIEKYYVALARGFHPRKTATIKNYLTRISASTGLVKIAKQKSEGGRMAHTDIEILDYNKKWNLSYVKCRIFTGRSHQIRVHLNSVGLPIIGDKKYNRELTSDLPGACQAAASIHHFLHASKIAFIHPKTKKQVEIIAPEPKVWHTFFNLFS